MLQVRAILKRPDGVLRLRPAANSEILKGRQPTPVLAQLVLQQLLEV